jgi:hypothetical protein
MYTTVNVKENPGIYNTLEVVCGGECRTNPSRLESATTYEPRCTAATSWTGPVAELADAAGLRICWERLEVAAGLEPAKIGFADRRLGLFGIATSNFIPTTYTQICTQTARKTPILPLFSVSVTY